PSPRQPNGRRSVGRKSGEPSGAIFVSADQVVTVTAKIASRAARKRRGQFCMSLSRCCRLHLLDAIQVLFTAQEHGLPIEIGRGVERFMMARIAALSREVNVFENVLSDLLELRTGLDDVRVAGVVGDVDVFSSQRGAGGDAIEVAVVTVVAVQPLA